MDIRKDAPIFQVRGFAPTPPTLPVFMVVLLHTEASGKRLFRRSVHLKSYECIRFQTISINLNPIILTIESS